MTEFSNYDEYAGYDGGVDTTNCPPAPPPDHAEIYAYFRFMSWLITVLGILVGILALTSCNSSTTAQVADDGAAFKISIPKGATAAEMVQMRGIMDNAFIIKAERERMNYELRWWAQFENSLLIAGVLFFLIGLVLFGIAVCIVCYRREKGVSV
jgi:hypothetical protein